MCCVEGSTDMLSTPAVIEEEATMSVGASCENDTSECPSAPSSLSVNTQHIQVE